MSERYILEGGMHEVINEMTAEYIHKLKHQVEQDKKTIEKMKECLKIYAHGEDAGYKYAEECLKELESEGE